MTQVHKLIAGPALIAASLIMAVVTPSTADANDERVLYSFRGTPDGANPAGGVIIDQRGILYGTTYAGGANGFGSVYKITKGRERVLYSFANAVDAVPTTRLIRDAAGNLYGATGTTGFAGSVYKVTPQGTESALHLFTGGNDGFGQVSDLVADDAGNLYGTTDGGGASNNGTVFKVTPTGEETVLYSFQGGGAGGFPKNKDGMALDAEGNLYGTTFLGGTNQAGTVFKLTPNGQATVLHSFTGADGGHPYSGLIMDEAGNLYGTTQFSGSDGFGTVFKLTSDGVASVLHAFTGGTDGGNPTAGLLLDRLGNLYGVTPRNSGNVYKLAPDGTETTLYSFLGSPDGSLPVAGLIMDAKGNLFGTTNAGGTSSDGTVFKVINTVTN